MRDLGTLGGASSLGAASNNRGWVTGNSVTADGYTHAFLKDGSTLQDLGTLAGMDRSSGKDINNRGWVVGSSSNYSYPLNVTAFLYDGNTMLDLCVLADCIVNGWESLTSAFLLLISAAAA